MGIALLLDAADYTEQAPVTDWPARIALVGVMLLVCGLVAWAMRRGWRNRARRQADLLPLPDIGEPGPADWSSDCRYVATAAGQDWLDRVVAGGLGAPGRARVQACARGLRVDRVGEVPVDIPWAALTSAASVRGLAQEVYERDGLVALDWHWRGRDLRTALRLPDAAGHTDLLRLVNDRAAAKG